MEKQSNPTPLRERVSLVRFLAVVYENSIDFCVFFVFFNGRVILMSLKCGFSLKFKTTKII